MADFTAEETTKLVDSFKELGVKPDLENADAFKQWMENFGKETKPTELSQAVLSAPRVSTFSGDTKDFDLWKYEVNCLREESCYSQETVREAVRRSLKGEAAKIAMRLGPSATLEELIAKLEGIYGIVEVGETLLAQFYNATQKPGEDVASWGCRVEDLLEKAKSGGQVKADAMPEMLRTRFWTGLRKPLKDVSGHLFQTIKDFDKLRVELRRAEHEHELNEKQKVKTSCSIMTRARSVACKASKPPQETDSKSELSEIKSMFVQLITTMQGSKSQPQGQGGDVVQGQSNSHATGGPRAGAAVYRASPNTEMTQYYDQSRSYLPVPPGNFNLPPPLPPGSYHPSRPTTTDRRGREYKLHG